MKPSKLQMVLTALSVVATWGGLTWRGLWTVLLFVLAITIFLLAYPVVAWTIWQWVRAASELARRLPERAQGALIVILCMAGIGLVVGLFITLTPDGVHTITLVDRTNSRLAVDIEPLENTGARRISDAEVLLSKPIRESYMFQTSDGRIGTLPRSILDLGQERTTVYLDQLLWSSEVHGRES